MSLADHQRELLLRHLDGATDVGEREAALRLLRESREARAFVRSTAEQVVAFAELERTGEERRRWSQARDEGVPYQEFPTGGRRLPVSAWSAGLALVAAVTLVIALGIPRPTLRKQDLARVSRVTGSIQYFGSNGRITELNEPGALLGSGDTLETRSCSTWAELRLPTDSALTLAGSSTLRLLNSEGGTPRLELVSGSLWLNPSESAAAGPLQIRTPTSTVESRGGQLSLQTSALGTIVRVNAGQAVVTRNRDGGVVVVPAGHQTSVSLAQSEPLLAVPQPHPVNQWAFDLWRIPEVLLGTWLPPLDGERARLGASPLLWPVPGRPPIMLYAVALAAWKSTDHPLLLEEGSGLRFRGRTTQARTVRFGFSTQKMPGVYSGKFETEVSPDRLAPSGETWEILLPLSEFSPLQSDLSPSPANLEMTDVYALTVEVDAGLEINHIELVPRSGRRDAPSRP